MESPRRFRGGGFGKGFYLFQFKSKEIYRHVFTGGPWVITNHYLTVLKWEPNFKPSLAEEITMAVCLRFPELPTEYYDAKALERIAKRLGKPIKTDYNTATSTRGKYARVFVEVDLSQSLIPAYTIEGKSYNVEYEFIHNLCLNCGKVGHRSELCREMPSTGVQTPANPSTGEANGMMNSDTYQEMTGRNGNLQMGNGQNRETRE